MTTITATSDMKISISRVLIAIRLPNTTKASPPSDGNRPIENVVNNSTKSLSVSRSSSRN
jgi:hypothetical protein